MPVVPDSYGQRSRLLHLTRRQRTYYVTFCTRGREVLPPGARTRTLASCTYDHDRLCWTDCVIVMPDHVHLITTPYEHSSIHEVLGRIKGASVHLVNRLLGRHGNLWLRESFDRMIRSADSLQQKREYIFNNPVRAGLVQRWEDYPWLWFPQNGRS